MLPSDVRSLYESYQSIYQQKEEDEISSEMIEEIVEELVEECLELGYTLEESTEVVQEAAELYFDIQELEEAKVTYGSDTESPEERTARAKERLASRKSEARKAAVKGAVKRVGEKLGGARAAAGIAGSIAKDEARRAGRRAQHEVGKAASAVGSAVTGAAKAAYGAAKEKKDEVKRGVKSLIGRGLRKVSGAAGVVAQKARKAGAAAGKAAERLGEETISEDPVQDYRDMQRAKQNASGVRGPELSHSSKLGGSAAQKPQPRSREFSHGGGSRPLKSVVKGGLTMSYEPEGDVVDENIQAVVKTGLDKASNFMKTNPVGKAASAVLAPVGPGRKTPTATSGGYRKEQFDTIDENVGGSVKLKPGSGLGGATPVYPKGQEPKATGAKLPSLQNAHYEPEDIYDLVMEYLLDNGHAESISEAHYIMTQMDVEMITDIVEETLDEARKATKLGYEKGTAANPTNRNIPTGDASQRTRLHSRLKSRADQMGRERRNSPEHKAGARPPLKKKEKAFLKASDRTAQHIARPNVPDTGSHAEWPSQRRAQRDPKQNPKHNANK
jgi:hypothetical protein